MRFDREPKARIPSELDVRLACDADLNRLWEVIGQDSEPPSARITIKDALVAGTSRALEPEDSPSVSDN